MELPTPPKPPEESSAAFLTDWDAWIRFTGFGELALSIVTLIFVWTRTAARSRIGDEFPPEIEIENRLPVKREKFSPKKGTAKEHVPFDSRGLARLREALKDISFRMPGLSFKSVIKGDALWILMVKARSGTQETVASAKAKLSILDDALAMTPPAFRERLESFLRQNGFEI